MVKTATAKASAPASTLLLGFGSAFFKGKGSLGFSTTGEMSAIVERIARWESANSAHCIINQKIQDIRNKSALVIEIAV